MMAEAEAEVEARTLPVTGPVSVVDVLAGSGVVAGRSARGRPSSRAGPT